ncbi:hypothetical protein CTAYLR_003112 [Chrysophaeum taylorii]|uniref:PX domain-containing protein n=1 Tax=Chrysophaeum taylorii TaxID=2483200 RepID=A0AAD7U6G0_9STRA|nr:hypothetical protein CTAYLR_003112 [Chrysophaeum taylorii]
MVTIQRFGIGFRYACLVDGRPIPEASTVPSSGFQARVTGHVTARDSGASTEWYAVESAGTTVHRRFRDFVELDESVMAALCGHHMRSSLPRLPPKKFKFTTDHRDPEFLAQRARDLDVYVRRLCDMKHAWAAPSMAPFFGVAESAREYSVLFPDRILGFTVGKCGAKKTPEKDGVYEPPDFPAEVASSASGPPDVGDLVSKISGTPTCSLRFKDVINLIKNSPRPIMIHFISTFDPHLATV